MLTVSFTLQVEVNLLSELLKAHGGRSDQDTLMHLQMQATGGQAAQVRKSILMLIQLYLCSAPLVSLQCMHDWIRHGERYHGMPCKSASLERRASIWVHSRYRVVSSSSWWMLWRHCSFPVAWCTKKCPTLRCAATTAFLMRLEKGRTKHLALGAIMMCGLGSLCVDTETLTLWLQSQPLPAMDDRLDLATMGKYNSVPQFSQARRSSRRAAHRSVDLPRSFAALVPPIRAEDTTPDNYDFLGGAPADRPRRFSEREEAAYNAGVAAALAQQQQQQWTGAADATAFMQSLQQAAREKLLGEAGGNALGAAPLAPSAFANQPPLGMKTADLGMWPVTGGFSDPEGAPLPAVYTCTAMIFGTVLKQSSRSAAHSQLCRECLAMQDSLCSLLAACCHTIALLKVPCLVGRHDGLYGERRVCFQHWPHELGLLAILLRYTPPGGQSAPPTYRWL